MACGIANVMGRDMVFVSSQYPWQAKMRGLCKGAMADKNFARGLELYNVMGGQDVERAHEALREYNRLTRRARCDPQARVISGVVREAAKVRLAYDNQCRPTYEPMVMGFGIRNLMPPKKMRDTLKKAGEAAAKVAKNPALPMVAAMVPGVGPGIAEGIRTYQTAASTIDKIKQGDALSAINLVATQAAAGNPAAEAALANIRKGAAIVNDLQKMEAPTPEAVRSLIASRAGVDISAVAKAMGVPPTAVTSSAVSKLAQGLSPTVSVTTTKPGEAEPAGVLSTSAMTPAAPQDEVLSYVCPHCGKAIRKVESLPVAQPAPVQSRLLRRPFFDIPW